MAQIKCKKCGNLIEVEKGAIIAVCDKCLLAQPINAENASAVPENNHASTNADVLPGVQSYLKRVYIFLEDEEWEKADEYCEKILDINPEIAEAYLCKLMAEFCVGKREDLINCEKSIRGANYDKIMRFGDNKIKAEIKAAADAIENRISPKIRPAEGESPEQEENKTTGYETAVAVNKTTSLEGETKTKKPSKKMLLILLAVLLVVAVAVSGIFISRDSAEPSSPQQTTEDNNALETPVIDENNIAETFANCTTISAGSGHTVGLEKDGTVVAVGLNDNGQCDVEGWSDIVSISAGYYHTVGLKKDGTVVVVGMNDYGQCDVEDWENIVAISAGGYHTVGLKKDGTVVATECIGEFDNGQYDVEDWKDIVAISSGGYHTVGLKKDGTVVAVGHNYWGQCDIEDWKDIVAISAGHYHTVGLTKDGTVVAVGRNNEVQCDVDGWKDIVTISAGLYYTVGVEKDGTVVVAGVNAFGECDAEDWKDIAAISAGFVHTVGLKKDGTVVATEYIGYPPNDYYGQCDVEGWKNIKLPK